MTITIVEINTAIKDELAAAMGLTFTQDFDELTEGMPDTPTLQVYWVTTRTDPTSGTAQSSFRGVQRQTRLTFWADLYARQRSHIEEDMGALLPLIDAIQTKLEEQRTSRFGLEGIRAIEGWTGQMQIFEDYAGAKYMGARFEIIVRVF